MNGFDQIATWISQNESLFSGLAAIVALIAIVPAALRPILRRRRADDVERSARKGRSPKSQDRGGEPRLAVLPIDVVGAGDELLTSSEILTAELTTLLACNNGCEVISRRSATAFALHGGTSKEAGVTLDVRYVVEGQVVAIGTDLRVSTNLVDTNHDKVVWSKAFETQDDGLTNLSRALAEELAAHLGIELTRAEVGRSRHRPKGRAARDLYLQAQGVLFEEGHNAASFTRAIQLLEQAIARDPEYADAYGQLALLVALGNIFGFVDGMEKNRDKALQACHRALELDDQSSDVLGLVGCAYCDLQLYDQGVGLLERAIELNPSNAQAKAALGTAFVGLRRYEDGVGQLEEALRLTPAYKGIATWATVLVFAYLRLDRVEEASERIAQAMQCDPSFFPVHLAASLLSLREGDPAAAKRHALEARRLYPELDAATIERIVGRRAGEQLIGWIGLEAPINRAINVDDKGVPK